MKFDHIGVVVPTLEAGRQHLAAILAIGRWTDAFEDTVNGVFVQFGLDNSDVCYELVAPLGEDSPIARTLAARDRILNHVAYLVPNLDDAASRLRAGGCLPAGPANPAIAYGGRQIQFFITPLRFIVELIEAPSHAHAFRTTA